RKVVDCISCHSHVATQMDPLHNGIPGYAFTSPKCLECHPQSTIPGIDHTAYFPIQAGQTHAGISCITCHPDRTHRTVVDCISCHTSTETNPLHTGIPGYAWTSPKCLECHPQNTIPTINHTAYFPIQAGDAHTGITCSSCHPNRLDRKVVDCLTCHPATATDPTHTRVGGYVRSSAQCLRCHGDSQVNPVSSHLPFAILSNYKHYRMSCLVCHPVPRTDKPFAQDFNPFDCLSCHSKKAMDDKHKSFPTYSYQSTSCTQSGCHQNGRKP
ncbi:MAG: hypothetical protein JXB05_04920, partial [Myxococcaceae bacterium]|nr:hypothetical protein [Myxococcaceae bacterium]